MLNLKGAVNRILLSVFLPAAAGMPAFGTDRPQPAFMLVEVGAHSPRTVAESVTTELAPVGSLLKPFAAWYLLERGLDARQTVFCPAERKRETDLRCWTPDGHGALNLGEALVHSCNYFFLSLFRGQSIPQFEIWLRERFQWPENLRIEKPVHVYGYELASGISVTHLVSMYAKLFDAAEAKEPHAALITQALAGTWRGTLKDFCRLLGKQSKYAFLWGKTGTVRDGKHQYGVAVLYLKNNSTGKKLLLICYERRKTGSQAALNAFAILKKYNP